MGLTEEQMQTDNGGLDSGNLCSSTKSQKLETYPTSDHSSDREGSYALCRVCHCVESDRRGDAALSFLDIIPPLQEVSKVNEEGDSTDKASPMAVEKDVVHSISCDRGSGFVEFISPKGEIFVCSTDVEAGLFYQQDKLIDLGCSCKNELALAHYACALKWFISRGSTICEICQSLAKNIRPADLKMVMASLNDYESLREWTATGEFTHVHCEANSGVDPDAVAAIRRQRLSTISLWFNPQNNFTAVSQGSTNQSSNILVEHVPHMESPRSKWGVEGTWILVATGLLMITLAWLIAPHVGKKTAKTGLRILLAGICVLTVVIFARFVVLSRTKYGPARYWAILFVLWFLVFGVWASRTHSARTT